MAIRHYVVALAVATLIAGCGGGEESTAVTPQRAAAALRAQATPQRAATTLAVSAEAAADQLLDFAESHLPNFFPSHQASQSLSPFRFRYYPETGIYLGVVVSANASYTLNGVYVVGPGFGTLAAPMYAGLVTDFITPTGGTGGGGGACFDLSLADVQGTKIEITYNYSGTLTGTESVTSTVGGLTTFEGHSARETTVVTTGSHPQSGPINTTGKTYSAVTGANEVTVYGAVFTATVSGFNASIRSVYTPPAVSRIYGLAVGESITETQAGTATTTITLPVIGDQVTSANISSTTTTKYVGQESVSVPAGTYNACKFEVTTAGSSDVSTSWFIVGKGLHVKTSVTGQTIEASSVKLNGAAL